MLVHQNDYFSITDKANEEKSISKFSFSFSSRLAVAISPASFHFMLFGLCRALIIVFQTSCGSRQVRKIAFV